MKYNTLILKEINSDLVINVLSVYGSDISNIYNKMIRILF